jgi:predicted flavoprotein YhiN
MSETITIRLRNKKAKNLLKELEELKLIEIIKDDIIPKHWSAAKKQRAKDLLEALQEAKLDNEGKIQLKTAQSLIDEL